MTFSHFSFFFSFFSLLAYFFFFFSSRRRHTRCHGDWSSDGALPISYNRWRDRSKAAGVEALPLDLGILGEIDYADHFRDFDPRGLWTFLEHLVAQSMHIYTQV